MTAFDISSLREQTDFEGKKAQGRNGRGELPEDFWRSYSGMANEGGGLIVLGITELQDGSFDVSGIQEPERVQKQLWDLANNRQRVSHNVLSNKDVRVEIVSGKSIIVVNVPRAERRDRPVYVGANPMTGTYRRNWTGDYLCSKAEVTRMLAEASEQPRDAALLPGFTLRDLAMESLAAYRQIFSSNNPSHPFLAEDDRGLLTKLGGWQVDRATGDEGLTVAGLLMFGRQEAILNRFPHYKVDYREVPDDAKLGATGQRYFDRVHVDGTWSGNLVDFYRRVFPKLVADLKVPFAVDENYTRKRQSPVHEAIQEALVNALIHADHYGTSGITILRKREGFEFRNPGDLRIPKSRALQGGISDCRNPALQGMMQMLGVGDRMGSGLPTIMNAWKAQHWRAPSLEEDGALNTVSLRLDMASLLPDAVLLRLDKRFPATFRRLPDRERMALVTAEVEGAVTNSRMQELCEDHPRDLTVMFQDLVTRGFLEPKGVNRWTWYAVAAHPRKVAQEEGGQDGAVVAGSQATVGLQESSVESSVESGPSSVESAESSVESFVESGKRSAADTSGHPRSSEHRDIHEQAPNETLRTDDNERHSSGDATISPQQFQARYPKTYEVASHAWLPRIQVLKAVVEFCDEYRSLEEIARALNRQPATVREYMRELAEQGYLERRYASINHPMQAYRSSGKH